jgi:hypothetical protein
MVFLPVTAEAQTMIRSSEELMPDAAEIVVIENTTLQIPSVAPEVSFEPTETSTGVTSVRPTAETGEWLERAADREVRRLRRSAVFLDSALRPRQQPVPQKRSWIGRHPVLFGTLVGFGAGFLIGYVPGDDGVFDDFVASFNGLVIGGIGAGAGAAIGAAVGASTK